MGHLIAKDCDIKVVRGVVMDVEFKATLDNRLYESRIEIQRLTNLSFLQNDLGRAMTKQKIEAHQERIKCIESLIRIENFLSELGSESQ